MTVMKKIVLSLMILFFLSITGMSGWCGDAKVPKAVVDQKEFGFDSVPEGIMVTHNFILKNTGDAVLKIENVKTA